MVETVYPRPNFCTTNFFFFLKTCIYLNSKLSVCYHILYKVFRLPLFIVAEIILLSSINVNWLKNKLQNKSLRSSHALIIHSDVCSQKDIWHLKVRSFLYYSSNTVSRWVSWISWLTFTRSHLSSNVYHKTNMNVWGLKHTKLLYC